MHISTGYKFKAIDGISKGKLFTVISAYNKQVAYKSMESGTVYNTDRKHFEKFIKRVNKHWADTTKAYKKRKQEL